MAEAFKACRTASQSISVASNGGRGSQEAADACSPRRRAIRHRHSAVDEGRGGRVVARHIHAKTPKFESFFGDDKKNKLNFDMWERQVLSAATTHSGTAVKQAMMKSLKGQALMVISALPPETSWDKLLQALKIKYQDKASYDVLMAQFYGTKIEADEKCASFGTRLEQKLNQVSLQYPNKISESMCEREILSWFIQGYENKP